MATTHQAANIPWTNLVTYSLLTKDIHHLADQNSPLIQKATTSLNYFIDSFASTVSLFAATESRKFERNDNMKADLIFDVFKNNIVLSGYSSPGAFKKILTDEINKKEITDYSDFSYHAGKHCEAINELFNCDQISFLLDLARTVPGLHQYAFVTYSNFFHYGYRRTLENALDIYLWGNFMLAKNRYALPDDLLHRFKSILIEEDYDSHLRIYREKWGKALSGSIAEEELEELQRFTFKKIYQYQLFMDEMTSHHKVEAMDWQLQIRKSIGKFLN